MAEATSLLEHFWNVFTLLTSDVKHCITVFEEDKVMDEAERMFWSRMLARSVFAMIEGVTYNMTGLAYCYPNHKDVLSPEEVEVLEDSYDFYEFQEPPIELKKKQTLDRLQRAFTFFARVHFADDYRLMDKPEWALIEEIYDWKQFWMHPRSDAMLIVDEESRKTLIEATLWLTHCVVDLLEKCYAGAEAHEDGPIM